MIASLRGKLILKENNAAVIECGGVGLSCFITQNTYSQLGNIGDEVFLYTYLSVREDALDLFGFSSPDEMSAFKLLTSVNGVGAKLAIAILSEFLPEKLMILIASGDSKGLTAASGVGLKLAQRIALELKDKVGAIASDSGISQLKAIGNASVNTASKEAVEALVSLGYSQSEASLAVGRLDQSLSVDEFIKQALRSLSRGL